MVIYIHNVNKAEMRQLIQELAKLDDCIIISQFTPEAVIVKFIFLV